MGLYGGGHGICPGSGGGQRGYHRRGGLLHGCGLLPAAEAREGLRDIGREELEGILRFACAAGSLATTRRGAIDALPTLDEVAASLK